jgi:hypothetical protein
VTNISEPLFDESHEHPWVSLLALSFLAPEHGLIGLLSIALLAVALTVRLRATRTCQVPTNSLLSDEEAGRSCSGRSPA